jgi:hypothetical protein
MSARRVPSNATYKQILLLISLDNWVFIVAISSILDLFRL